jgi:hypothetical protein
VALYKYLLDLDTKNITQCGFDANSREISFGRTRKRDKREKEYLMEGGREREREREST